MKKVVESNVVEFNLENIMNGKYAELNGKKSGNWNMFNSIRLLKESGQQVSEQLDNVLSNLKYKWTYNTRKSDNKLGNIIVKLHVKGETSSLYIVARQDGKLFEYKTLEDAKSNIDIQ